MDKKVVSNISTALNTLGVLVLLVAAFDVVPVADNTLIFASLASFIIAASIRRLIK